MPKITFGEIEHGWAQMWFDTGSERLTVAGSYLREPFAALADVASAMLQLPQPAKKPRLRPC